MQRAEKAAAISRPDGEVRVDRAHLVSEALGDTLDHVADVRDDSVDAGEALAVAERLVRLRNARDAAQ